VSYYIVVVVNALRISPCGDKMKMKGWNQCGL